MPSGKKNWGIIKPPPGAVLDWGDPINKGLVGCWLMNEGAGTKVFDISGKNNHGTLTNGPTWTAGKFGQGLNFDGVNDYTAIADSGSLHQSVGSVSYWVNATALSGSLNRSYGKATGGWANGQGSLIMGFRNSSGWKTELVYPNGGTPTSLYGSTAIVAGSWYHVVGTYDGTTYKIYLNGSLDGSVAKAGNAFLASSGELCIGGDGSTGVCATGNVFNGKIDEVRIYNRALSETELRRLYTEPFAGILMPRRKVLYVAGADATSFFDGKIVIKSSGTNLLDGKVKVKDVITALLDGKVSIGSIQQDILDGKLRIKDTGISYLDGKVIVKDIATTLLDGKLEITQGGTDTASLDAKIRIKDALTALVDGKVIVKSTATDILDGKLTIGTGATNLLDGKIQIKDIATALLDGKIQVKSATVSLLDGKIVIADGISSFSSNNQLLIDSIGGKVLQLGNSRINTWNTAGRPSSPKTGTIGLNTQTIALDVFNGSTWKSITLS